MFWNFSLKIVHSLYYSFRTRAVIYGPATHKQIHILSDRMVQYTTQEFPDFKSSKEESALVCLDWFKSKEDLYKIWENIEARSRRTIGPTVGARAERPPGDVPSQDIIFLSLL